MTRSCGMWECLSVLRLFAFWVQFPIQEGSVASHTDDIFISSVLVFLHSVEAQLAGQAGEVQRDVGQ